MPIGKDAVDAHPQILGPAASSLAEFMEMPPASTLSTAFSLLARRGPETQASGSRWLRLLRV